MVFKPTANVNVFPGPCPDAAATSVLFPLACRSQTTNTGSYQSNVQILQNLFANTGGIAPGAGKSYVYTIKINGSNTSITCTITGASQTTNNDVAHQVALARADRWECNITGVSSPAATATHKFGLSNGGLINPANAFVACAL